MILHLKEGIKILGVACSTFDRNKDKEVELYGVVYRSTTLLEGVMKTIVQVDGEDGTEKIQRMVNQSPHKEQLKLIMTRGITLAGFNYINIKQLYEKTELPVISVVDRVPNLEKIKEAIQNVSNWKERFNVIANSSTIQEISTSLNEEPVFVQAVGIENKELDKLLKKITIVGRIPEPIRVARLIATGTKAQPR